MLILSSMFKGLSRLSRLYRAIGIRVLHVFVILSFLVPNLSGAADIASAAPAEKSLQEHEVNLRSRDGYKLNPKLELMLPTQENLTNTPAQDLDNVHPDADVDAPNLYGLPLTFVENMSQLLASADETASGLQFSHATAQESALTPTPTPQSTGVLDALNTIEATPLDNDCSDGECVFGLSSGSDDAARATGGPVSCAYSNSHERLWIGECNGLDSIAGFRFTGVTLPQNALIAEAYLEVPIDGRYTSPIEWLVVGEASNDANTFNAGTGWPSQRTQTTNSATWLIEDEWLFTMPPDTRQSPNIATIVQEIINRSGWDSGNALAILVEKTATYSGP